MNVEDNKLLECFIQKQYKFRLPPKTVKQLTCVTLLYVVVMKAGL